MRLQVGSLLRAQSAPTAVDGDLVTQWQLPVDVAPGHEQPRRADPLRRGRTPRRDRRALARRGRRDRRRAHDRRRRDAPVRRRHGHGALACPANPPMTAMRCSAHRTCSAASRHPPMSPPRRRSSAPRTAPPTARSTTGARSSFRLLPARTASTPWSACGARRTHDDPSLAALAFHYGRYLLIASSQPGGLPITLQGLWNAELPGPWSSAYTLNINTQMAYWPAETTGLAECHEPLLRFTRRLSETTGPAVARELYGADGWVAHHNSDAWAHAAPVGAGHGDPAWANWSLGGVWLALHLWEHYAFSRDRAFLRAEAWPVLASAAAFALSWIQTDGERAWTSPSTSPENHYVDADGRERGVAVTATMDVALLRELAAVCRAGADGARACDEPWVAELTARTGQLPDPRVSARGRPARVGSRAHRRPSRSTGISRTSSGCSRWRRSRRRRRPNSRARHPSPSGCGVPSRRAGRSRGAPPCRRVWATARPCTPSCGWRCAPRTKRRPRRARPEALRAPRRALPEPLQRPPAVPDRRQPRRDRGDRGGPGAVLRRAGRGRGSRVRGSTPPACGCGCCPRFRRSGPTARCAASVPVARCRSTSNGPADASCAHGSGRARNRRQ